MADLYDADFGLWTERQADALRRRAGNEIDWENVAEEIETLGNNNKRELASRITTLLVHLLKLRLSPAAEPRRQWQATAIEQQAQIKALIRQSPSLRSGIAVIIEEELPTARKLAALALDEHGELAADIMTITFDEKDVLDGKTQ
jgi:Domain of unknown function DUF29